jgi:hypothetical protein
VLNWNELYRERLKAVEFFSKKNEIDLYGRGWERAPARLGYGVLPGTVQHLLRNSEEQWRRIFPDPAMTAARKAWRGVAPSKSETISKYTFAMCFENSVLKGWITEKIFDCFFVGTVPIYWGAPEITDYVPKSTFIDMRDFSSYEELRSFLKGLGPNEISAYRQSGRDFIASSAFHRFSKAAFVDIFRKIVKEDAGVAL